MRAAAGSASRKGPSSRQAAARAEGQSRAECATDGSPWPPATPARPHRTDGTCRAHGLSRAPRGRQREGHACVEQNPQARPGLRAARDPGDQPARPPPAEDAGRAASWSLGSASLPELSTCHTEPPCAPRTSRAWGPLPHMADGLVPNSANRKWVKPCSETVQAPGSREAGSLLAGL